MLPLVTGAYAAVFGLFAAFLTVRVIMSRVKSGVTAGDGGNAELAQAIRAHANFAEHVPLALLLIGFAEAAGAPVLAIHGLAGLLLVARLANAWGLSHSLGPTTGRQAGAGMTLFVTVVASLLILYRVLVSQ
jgi:uncharacterized membrane protein YecN with MAPEG domain